MKINNDVRISLEEQRVRLAGMEVPTNLDPTTRHTVEEAIADSFNSGFRRVILGSVGLALGSALSSWIFIGRSGQSRATKPG
jgi:hypothetical protein